MNECVTVQSRVCIAVLMGWLAWSSASWAEEQNPVTVSDLAAYPAPEPLARITYGNEPLQFAELRVPQGAGPFPVIILIHGGCWLSTHTMAYVAKLAEAFTQIGIATWNVEYRRVGDAGGGWPGTFEDVAQAADRLLDVSSEYSLDISRVIAVGHSAGGQMALWLAARQRFPEGAQFSSERMVHVMGVLALAPAPDLANLYNTGVCDAVIDKLMGGSPTRYPDRYALGSPIELLPLGVEQILVLGANDNWSEEGRRYFLAGQRVQDLVSIIEAPQSGHFEMVDPDSSTWPLVMKAAYKLLELDSNQR